MKFEAIIKFLAIFLLVFVNEKLYSQNISTAHQISHENQKMYIKGSDKEVSIKEFKKIQEDYPNLFIKPIFNKYGNPESFQIDTLSTDASEKIDPSDRAKPGMSFPPFIMNSIEGKKINSEKLKGNIVILYFQVFLTPPFFNEKNFKDYNELIFKYKEIKSIESIIITDSSGEDVLKTIGKDTIYSQIVPNGRNFNNRYLVINFPSFILLDENGNLISYFENSNLKALEENLKSIKNTH